VYVPDPAKDTTNFRSALHRNTQDFAGFALGNDLEWPATDLAVGCEPLCRDAGVEHDFEALAAKWALDGFGDFHMPIVSGFTRLSPVCINRARGRRGGDKSAFMALFSLKFWQTKLFVGIDPE
jgi:hypothetical protein